MHSIRTRRGGGIVAAVVDSGEVVASHVEIPTGTTVTVAAMIEWIGADRDRATLVADHRWQGVRNHAATILETV